MKFTIVLFTVVIFSYRRGIQYEKIIYDSKLRTKITLIYSKTGVWFVGMRKKTEKKTSARI